MASVRQRNGSFEVRAQHGGKVYSKTFRSRTEAERWGAGIELGFVDAPTRRAPNARWMTFREVAERYGREVTPNKKGREQELNRLKQLVQQGWATKPISEVSTTDMKRLRDGMLERGLSGSTVRLMMALVSVVFKHARQEWDVDAANPVAEIRIPRASPPRYRRVSAEEEERLEGALDRCKNPTMGALVRFALQTGMRRSELVQLKWTDVDFEKRLVILHTSKNGHPRWIPLTAKALEQLQLQQAAGQARPFDISAGAVSLAWCHVVRRAGLKNLHFHDLRHEALSRWAHRLGGDVFKLSLVSGHKTLQMARRYVHPVESELLAALSNA